jgi:GNAT superfamily N-acetyltransferase
VETWRTAYAELMPRSAIEAHTVDERRDMWSTVLVDTAKRVLLVEDDEGVAGFALVGPSVDDDLPQATGEIFGMYLVQRAIGLGVGRELLRRATRTLLDLGCARGTLWVLEANRRARRFYEAAGWRADGAIQPFVVGDIELPVVRYRADLGGDGTPDDR